MGREAANVLDGVKKKGVTAGGKCIRKMARVGQLWMPKCLDTALHIITFCVTV